MGATVRVTQAVQNTPTDPRTCNEPQGVQREAELRTMQQSKPLLFVVKTKNSTAGPLWYETEVQFADAHDEPF